MQELFLNSEASVQSDRILYTPSLFARSALLNLQEVGSLKARSPHTSTRSGLTSYLYCKRSIVGIPTSNSRS